MCTKHYRIVSYALFANEGEPEQSADFLARVRENKVDFLDFMVPGAWGTIWGTTWFEVRGRIDRESVKGRAVELVVDLGWKRHRGPGFQAEGLCYRPDGSVIKAVNPDNCWIPLIDANGVANVELDDAGRFTVYVEAASNPLVEADLPFAPMNLGGACRRSSIRLCAHHNGRVRFQPKRVRLSDGLGNRHLADEGTQG